MEYSLPPSCTPAHRTWGLYWEGIPTVNQIKSSIPPVALIASKHFLSSADGLLRQQPLHVDVHQSCPTSTSDLHPVLSACLAELQQLCQVCHSLRLIHRCCSPPPPGVFYDQVKCEKRSRSGPGDTFPPSCTSQPPVEELV